MEHHRTVESKGFYLGGEKVKTKNGNSLVNCKLQFNRNLKEDKNTLN